LELYIADLASVGIARQFEQQRDSSRRLDSAKGRRLLFALLKQHTHQGCVAPVHIGRRNRPTGLFCVELVTFGRGSLPVARRFSPALRPSNNFADTKTPKTSAMEHLFSSLLLAFVSPVFFLRALGTPAVCKAPDSTSGRPTAKLLTVLPVSQPLKKFQGTWTKS